LLYWSIKGKRLYKYRF